MISALSVAYRGLLVARFAVVFVLRTHPTGSAEDNDMCFIGEPLPSGPLCVVTLWSHISENHPLRPLRSPALTHVFQSFHQALMRLFTSLLNGDHFGGFARTASSHTPAIKDTVRAERFLMFLCSLVMDRAVFLIAKHWRIKPNMTMFIYATSFAPYCIFVQPNCSTFETMAFAIVLYLIVSTVQYEPAVAGGGDHASLACREDALPPSTKYPTFFLIGAVSTVGLWIRPGFVVFILTPILHLLVSEARPVFAFGLMSLNLLPCGGKSCSKDEINGSVTFADDKAVDGAARSYPQANTGKNAPFHPCMEVGKCCSSSQLTVSVCFEFLIFIGTVLFGAVSTGLILSMLDSVFLGLLDLHGVPDLCDFDGWVALVVQNLTVVPLNYCRKVLNFTDLVNASVQPWYKHVVMNLPHMYGILGILTIYFFFQCFSYSVLPNLHLINTKYWLFLSSFITPLMLSSIYPRQLAFDLAPLLVPLAFLTCIRISSFSDIAQRRILVIWTAWNAMNGLYYGVFNNGGTLSTSLWLESRLIRRPNASISVHFLATEPVNIVYFNSNLRNRLAIHDWKLADLSDDKSGGWKSSVGSEMARRIRRNVAIPVDQNSPHFTYLVVPGSANWCNLTLPKRFSVKLVALFYGHFSLPAPPDLVHAIFCHRYAANRRVEDSFQTPPSLYLGNRIGEPTLVRPVSAVSSDYSSVEPSKHNCELPCTDSLWGNLVASFTLRIYRVSG